MEELIHSLIAEVRELRNELALERSITDSEERRLLREQARAAHQAKLLRLQANRKRKL